MERREREVRGREGRREVGGGKKGRGGEGKYGRYNVNNCLNLSDRFFFPVTDRTK